MKKRANIIKFPKYSPLKNNNNSVERCGKNGNKRRKYSKRYQIDW